MFLLAVKATDLHHSAEVKNEWNLLTQYYAFMISMGATLRVPS
jgi:hypothetical protein